MISTPTRADTLFSRIISKISPKTGLPIVQSIRVGEPCADCMKVLATAHKCTHNFDEMPFWKSKEKRDEFNPLMEEYQETNLQENCGVTVDRRLKLFSSEHLKLLADQPLYEVTEAPKCIYLAVDPTGGGKCEFGLIGCFYSGTEIVVCFLLH